jgi:hypothetical protein
MSGLGNGHRYGSIAKVSSCYVLWRVEVGGRAWRGGARVLIAATWEAGWRGVARCRVGCWIRGATSEEQVSRKGTRGGCPAASLAVCVCWPGEIEEARSKSGVALGQKRGHVKPGTVSQAHRRGTWLRWNRFHSNCRGT